MVHAEGEEFEAAQGDPLTVRTFTTFFDVLRVLVSARVSVVAEAAFQDRLWKRGLEPFLGDVQLRVVHCVVDPAVAWGRAAQRVAARPAHAVGEHVKDVEAWKEHFASFEYLSLTAPAVTVDTTDGYSPVLPEIVEFVNRD